MAGVGKQKSLRKALGAIKDSTTVGLANLNSNYKELDIAIVKATNHVERPPKERHVQAIFSAVSAARPRADVAYCIRALARRLSKTHNWAVALKSLIVIHRALREVDPSFREELINYANRRSHILNLAHFKDDSSPYAWDYSAWVRTYALFLEERLECFHVLKYDIETQPSKTKELDTAGLLEQLPALQQLLYRLLSCQLQGAAARNFVIQLAFSMVANESIKIYNAISEGTVNLVDKFFEMQRHDAINALDIYRKMWQQVEKLNEFYDVCKRFDLSRGERFVKIEQPPESFLTAMEDYVKEAPRTSFARKDQVINNKIAGPKVVLALEYKSTPEEKVETKQDTPPSLETTKTEAPQHESSDLLGLNDPNPIASDLDEKNSLALAIVPSASSSTGFSSSEINQQNLTTGWELALVTASNSTDSATSASKLAGGLDKLTLDSLYDDALRRANQNVSYNPWEVGTMGTTITQAVVQDPFHASTTMAAPPSVQMAAMAQQQQAFLLQQQMVMMGQQQQQQPHNPFANPYAAGPHVYNPGMPVQAYNPHTGLI